MKNLLLGFGVLFCLLYSQRSEAKASPYRLGIVIVVDQFRADFLTRFKDRFISSRNGVGGFKFLMDGGAYFPLADHGLFQNMTCPGHAAILTGSYPYRNGISMNLWYDREKKQEEYCVRDATARLIGKDGIYGEEKNGVSPKYLNATTVGDELKNAGLKTRVVSVSFKDRAAVMLGGKRPDLALWMSDKSCQWLSSQYYLKGQPLPEWAAKQSEKLAKLKNKKYSWGPYKEIEYCSKESIRTPWIAEQTFQTALAAVKGMKLGQGEDVDLLTISLSSHDYLGHALGPNDEAMDEMVLDEDRLIEQFLKEVAQQVPGGLKDVFVVLTGDHGTPPAPKTLPKELPNGNISEDQHKQIIETALTEAFGKPKGGKWIQFLSEFQIYLNQDALKDAKVTAQKVGAVLRERLLKEKYVQEVWVRDDILVDRKVPPGDLGQVVDRTITTKSGDILIVFNPFFFSDSWPVSHMTHYSYDRYVPLIIWGKTFKAGVRNEIVKIIDLAPTLSRALGVVPPSQSEGRVISEILR